MKKISLILTLLVAFLFTAFQMNKRQIAEHAFDKALGDRVVARINPERQDGIHVFVCGAGAPMPTLNAGPCTAVIAGDRTFIFDTGLYRIDSGFRVEHHGTEVANPSGHGGTPKELQPGVVYNTGGVKITAMTVPHEPVEPAFGYRIDYKDRSVTISGDTSYSEAFAHFSKDTDLIVHEGLQPKMVLKMRDVMKEHDLNAQAKIMDDILNYHTSPEDAARVAQIAGADELLITHIIPPLPVELLYPLFLGDAKKNFDGKIHLAEDGMTFSLPSGSDAIIKNREF